MYKRACKETEHPRERSEDYELKRTAAAAGAWCANACARAIVVYWHSLTAHLYAPQTLDVEAELASALAIGGQHT